MFPLDCPIRSRKSRGSWSDVGSPKALRTVFVRLSGSVFFQLNLDSPNFLIPRLRPLSSVMCRSGENTNNAADQLHDDRPLAQSTSVRNSSHCQTIHPFGR